MRRWPIVMVLAVLTIGVLLALHLRRQAALDREVGRLSLLFDRDLDRFLGEGPEMPALAGDAVEGTAAACYLEAIRDGRLELERLVTISAASRDGARINERDLAFLGSLAETLDLFSAGARTRYSGCWRSPGNRTGPGPVMQLDALAVAACMDAIGRLEAGKADAALKRLLELRRFTADLARGGSVFAAMWAPGVGKRFYPALERVLCSGAIDPEQVAVAESFLRSLLSTPDVAARAIEGEMLDTQFRLRAYLRKGPGVARIDLPSVVPAELRNFFNMEPPRADIVVAWEKARSVAAAARALRVVPAAESRRRVENLLASQVATSSPAESVATYHLLVFVPELLAHAERTDVRDRGVVIALAAMQGRTDPMLDGSFEIREVPDEDCFAVYHLDPPEETELIRFRPCR